MSAKSQLEALIRKSEKGLAASQLEVEELIEKTRAAKSAWEISKAELAAFKKALDIIESPERPAGTLAAAKKRGRTISPVWEDILMLIGCEGEMSLDQLEKYCETKYPDQGRKSIRSQLSNYRKKGVISNDTEQGYYRLTDEGKALYYFDVEPPIMRGLTEDDLSSQPPDGRDERSAEKEDALMF